MLKIKSQTSLLRRNRSRGFTLVELLVVVAIIALLLSILLPALGRARAIARSVKCLSNMRSMGLGFSMYTQDNYGFLPPYRVDFRPADYQSGPHAIRIFHHLLLGQYTNQEPTEDAAWGPVLPGGMWRCPDDQMTTGNFKASYAMINNNSGLGKTNFFPRIRTQTGDSWPGEKRWKTLPKLSQVKHPSVLMGITEKNGRAEINFSASSWPSVKDPHYRPLYAISGNTSGLSWSYHSPDSNYNHNAWHPPYTNGLSAGSNMVFMDGHAQTIVNTPSDVDGVLWLNDAIGRDVVFRPQDY